MKYSIFILQQFTTWVNPGDALYPTLTEIYLKFFLPITGKSVPSLPNYTPVRSPVAHHSPVYRYDYKGWVFVCLLGLINLYSVSDLSMVHACRYKTTVSSAKIVHTETVHFDWLLFTYKYWRVNKIWL